MTLTAKIRDKISKFPEGKTFRYEDLCINKSEFLTAAKAMERMQKSGVIKKVSKGVFYKSEKSIFGELKPDYSELLRPYLFENGKRVAYETGTSLYRRIGLTTQMTFRIKIASRSKRITITRGLLKVDSVKSYADVDDNNYEILGLLDAVKDIKRIPDCTVDQAVRRLSVIIKNLSTKQSEELIEYALLYPARVRALLGAVLENNNYEFARWKVLKETLNPFTIIKLGINETELPTIVNWNIK